MRAVIAFPIVMVGSLLIYLGGHLIALGWVIAPDFVVAVRCRAMSKIRAKRHDDCD